MLPAMLQVCVSTPAQQSLPAPSSQLPSQSSSMPLHTSTGGVQLPGGGRVQVPVQAPEPTVLQEVVQGRSALRQHAKPSSQTRSQSSSAPLQISAGGVHAPQPQPAVQVRDPVEPQAV
jgi:hypothetical protein